MGSPFERTTRGIRSMMRSPNPLMRSSVEGVTPFGSVDDNPVQRRRGDGNKPNLGGDPGERRRVQRSTKVRLFDRGVVPPCVFGRNHALGRLWPS